MLNVGRYTIHGSYGIVWLQLNMYTHGLCNYLGIISYMTSQAILSHPAHCCVVLFLVSSHHICDTWAVMDMSCLLRGHYLMPPCCYYYHQTYEGSFKFRCGPQQCIEGNNGLLTHLPVDCAGRSSSKYQEDTETRDKEKASEATGRTPSVVGDLCLACQACFWMKENGGEPIQEAVEQRICYLLHPPQALSFVPTRKLKGM